MDAIPDPKQGPTLISTTTVLSLLSTITILGAAYIASIRLLPSTASSKTRLLFIWHAFDALIHFILEGSFLYNCFFSYNSTLPSPPDGLWNKEPSAGGASAYLPPNVFFLNHTNRMYGSAHGSNVFAALWREYARADARWGGTDLTVVSLEILTVFVAGPLAVWVCHCLRRGRSDAWFWMIVIATGEIYGGFMTFAPELLSGSPNLDTSNWMYLWVYLVFFNMLWVWIPGWVLYEGYGRVTAAMALHGEKKTR